MDAIADTLGAVRPSEYGRLAPCGTRRAVWRLGATASLCLHAAATAMLLCLTPPAASVEDLGAIPVEIVIGSPEGAPSEGAPATRQAVDQPQTLPQETASFPPQSAPEVATPPPSEPPKESESQEPPPEPAKPVEPPLQEPASLPLQSAPEVATLQPSEPTKEPASQEPPPEPAKPVEPPPQETASLPLQSAPEVATPPPSEPPKESASQEPPPELAKPVEPPLQEPASLPLQSAPEVATPPPSEPTKEPASQEPPPEPAKPVEPPPQAPLLQNRTTIPAPASHPATALPTPAIVAPRRAETARPKQATPAPRRLAKLETGDQRERSMPADDARSGAVGGRSPTSAADIDAYKSTIVSRINAAKRYPDEARSRGARGVAMVTFSIDAAGRVGAASVQRSSGDAGLDGDALATVRRASPYPPPPPGAPRLYTAALNYRQP